MLRIDCLLCLAIVQARQTIGERLRRTLTVAEPELLTAHARARTSRRAQNRVQLPNGVLSKRALAAEMRGELTRCEREALSTQAYDGPKQPLNCELVDGLRLFDVNGVPVVSQGNLVRNVFPGQPMRAESVQ